VSFIIVLCCNKTIIRINLAALLNLPIVMISVACFWMCVVYACAKVCISQIEKIKLVQQIDTIILYIPTTKHYGSIPTHSNNVPMPVHQERPMG